MTTSLEETSQGGRHLISLLQVRDAPAAFALQAWLETFPAELGSESPLYIVLWRTATGYGQRKERTERHGSSHHRAGRDTAYGAASR